jgi:hypothetical protein
VATIQRLTSQSRQLRVLLGGVLANVDGGPLLERGLDYKVMMFLSTFQGLAVFLGKKTRISPKKSKPIQVAGMDFLEKFADFSPKKKTLVDKHV